MKKILLCCVMLASTACGGGSDPTSPGDGVTDPRPLDYAYLNRLPQPDDLAAVSEFGGRAVAVGDLGTVVVFEEGARDWSRIPSPTRARFTDVLMIDAGRVLAVATDGIWLSEDSGSTWEQVLDTTRVRRLARRGDKVVAAGTEVLLSDDLRKWKSPRVPPVLGRICKDVAFAGDLIWLLEDEALHRSDDGGETWAKRVLSPDSPFSRFAFADQNFGVVATLDGELFNTTNGSTFQPLQELRSRVVDIDFPLPGFGVLVTQDLIVSTSLSRGKDWQSTVFTGIEGGAADIELTTDGELLIVGTEGLIAKTREGGTVLDEISSGFPFDVRVLAFANPRDGLAIAAVPGTLLLRTNNGGIAWEAQPSPVPVPEDVAFLDDDLGLILDASGAIMKTTTLGASWVDTGASSTSPRMAGLFIFDERTWMACGLQAIVIRTTDAGATWTEVQLSGTEPALDDFVRVPGTDTVLAFSNRAIFRSEDAGATWSEVEGDTRFGDAIACPDENTVISVGDVIYRSEDQGRSWSAVRDSPEPLYAVEFLDARHGIAVGDDGMIFETLDGGRSWDPVEIVGQPLLDVVALDGDTVLMAGEDAVVIAGQRARR